MDNDLLPADWKNAVEMLRAAGYVHPADVIEQMAATILKLEDDLNAPISDDWR